MTTSLVNRGEQAVGVGGCTTPCSARGLERMLRRRYFNAEGSARRLLVGAALAVLLAGLALFIIAPAVVGIVVAGWGLMGLAVALGQAWLAAAAPARAAMPAELARLVEDNTGRIHPARLPELRARAAALTIEEPNFGTLATRFLLELREATGEAWRCPCPERKRRLPLPF